jgi:hypothetical protein
MNTLKYIHILSNILKDIEIYYKDTIHTLNKFKYTQILSNTLKYIEMYISALNYIGIYYQYDEVHYKYTQMH